MSWIQTFTGLRVDLLDPRPEQIDIVDIAHSLSQLCRYTGHSRRFYSVAEHSVHVSHLVRDGVAFQALMHDATEAYVADMATPLKNALPEYREIEQRMWRAIAIRYSLPPNLHPDVKVADLVALKTEKQVLHGPSPEPWHIDSDEFPIDPAMQANIRPRWWLPLQGHPAVWRERFLERFDELDGDWS